MTGPDNGSGRPGRPGDDSGPPEPPVPHWPDERSGRADQDDRTDQNGEDDPADRADPVSEVEAGGERIRIPDSPAELTGERPDDPPAEEPTPPRNGPSWLALGLGTVAFVAVVTTGAPFGLFLAVFALSFGISSWVRVRRGTATALRQSQLAVVLALVTFAVSVYWMNNSGHCASESDDRASLERCVNEHTGLF